MSFNIQEFIEVIKDNCFASTERLYDQEIEEVISNMEDIRANIRSLEEDINEAYCSLREEQNKYEELVAHRDEISDEDCNHLYEEVTDRSGMGGVGYYEKCIYCGDEK